MTIAQMTEAMETMVRQNATILATNGVSTRAKLEMAPIRRRTTTVARIEVPMATKTFDRVMIFFARSSCEIGAFG